MVNYLEQQKLLNYKTLAVHGQSLTQYPERLSLETYNQFNDRYNSPTAGYWNDRKEKVCSEATKIVNSNTSATGNIYIYKVLVEMEQVSLTDNIEQVKGLYKTFNSKVSKTYTVLNKASKRSKKSFQLIVTNNATEHAFRDNFQSIKIHNHALILTNEPIELEKLQELIQSKLPDNYHVNNVLPFNKLKDKRQLVLNDKTAREPDTLVSIKNYIQYIYKTIAQKPIKTLYELKEYEKLSTDERYELIRGQQLITKGLRKHTAVKSIQFKQHDRPQATPDNLTPSEPVTNQSDNTGIVTTEVTSTGTQNKAHRGHIRPLRAIIATVIGIYILTTSRPARGPEKAITVALENPPAGSLPSDNNVLP